MTTPDERTESVLKMQQAALDATEALHKSKTGSRSVLVDRSVLEAMASALRHFPTRTKLVRLAEAEPTVLSAAPVR